MSRYSLYSRLISELEPRVMFDGAAALVAEDVANGDGATLFDQDTQDASAADTAFAAQGAALANGSVDMPVVPREVVIYDPNVDGLDDLLGGMNDEALVFELNANEDPMIQIANIMADVGAISGLHIISHGDDGAIELGGTTVTTDTLFAARETLALWQSSLTDEADILLYGCKVGGSLEGQSFLNAFSALTGADVAASDDLTGTTALDGDWDLEVQVGAVETEVLSSLSGYNGILTTDMTSASTNFSEVLKGATFDPGGDTQAQAAADLVGDDNNAMLYIKYDDQGTAGDTSDDEIYLRVRTDNSADKSQGFSGYTWMGMDVDSDGDLDAFLMAFGTSQGFSINVYNAGTGANVSPGTTDLDSNAAISIVSKEAVSVITSGSGGNAVVESASSASSYFAKVTNVDTSGNGNGNVADNMHP